MPTTTTQSTSSDAKSSSNSSTNGNISVGGFSLMNSLKGGASVVSSSNSDADSTAIFREGLTSPVKVKTPTRTNTNTQPASSHISSSSRSPPSHPMAHPHSAAVPMRQTKSFMSSSNYYNQQQKQQQQQRRTAPYRSAPKKIAPKNSAAAGAGSGGGVRWAFPGLSPAKSMDSADQQPSRRGGGSSIFTSAPSTAGHSSSSSNDQFQSSLKTTSFDDCYAHSPGYHDAFTLLEGVERASNASSSSQSSNNSNNNATIVTSNTTPSPRNVRTRSNTTPSPRSGGGMRSFFPASPNRSAPSPNRSAALKVAPSSPKRHVKLQASPPSPPMRDISSGTQATIDGSAGPPLMPIGDGPSAAAAPNTPMHVTAASPSFGMGMPAPPSATKNKPAAATAASKSATVTATLKARAATRAASPSPLSPSTTATTITTTVPTTASTKPTTTKTAHASRGASPLRTSSPLSASRMKHTLQKTWSRAKKGSVQISSHHSRTRAKGSGNYSDAVSKALQEDAMGRDVEIVDHTKIEKGERPPKSGGAKSSGTSKSQEGIEVISSPSTPKGGGARLKRGSVGRQGRLRHRSPSPVRHLGSVGRVDNAKSAASANDDRNDDATEPNNNEKNNNPSSLHMDKDSTASTPSFFNAHGIRNMSPGRVKKNWRKRVTIPAIPASPRRNSQNRRPSQSSLPPSPDKHSLPLHPTYQSGKGEGSIEEEDQGMDQMVTSLAHTTMSFDVDDLHGSSTRLNYNNATNNGVTSRREESALPPHLPIQPVLENDVEEEEGYFINTTSFNIFESRDFLRAMGGRASEASLATNYIRTGDELCSRKDAGKDAEEEHTNLNRAVQVYYAGLGKVLTRIREWSSERLPSKAPSELLDVNGNYIPAAQSASRQGKGKQTELLDVNGNYIPPTAPDTRDIAYKDLLEVAHSPETNVLLLAMSSILLRAGNAHFRREQWPEACRDYVSAQSYRSLRHMAKDGILGEKLDYSAIHVEDAKLNGRISNNMASAQSKRGMYEKARVEYTKALQIKQGTLEALHKSSSSGNKKDVDDENLVSDIASTFHNIGLLRMNCGEPKKAEKAYKQSLSLRVKKFGLDDLGVSSTLRALGELYYQLKQYDDAFRSYKESLRIWKTHSGKSDLKTAEHYYNIGLVFYSKGPFIKARTSVAECLRIRRLLCSGKERLPIASALHLLGLIASSSGNYDEALLLLEESLAIRRALLESHDHLLLLNVQLVLGTVHHKRNDWDSAMDCFSVALAGRTRRLGKDHISVSEVLQAIGVVYTSAEEYHKAFKTLEEALRIRKAAASGGTSLEVAETLNSLSLILFKSGDAEKAIELSEEALDVLKTAVGFDHLLVGKVLKNTGDYYQDVEAYDDAMEAYSESLRVMTAWYGREHVFLSEVLNEIGVTRFKNGEFMIAKQSFTEALRLMRLTHNEANKSAIFPTLNHLGHALYKNNELKLAAETYIESFNIQVSIVTGDANDGLKEFGAKLNIIKDRIAIMERKEEDVTELSESLGGIASILRYLGLVIQEQGDFEAALSTHKLSLSVRLCQPFKEHFAIALMAETIAMFEYKRSNLPSAMDYFNQALEAKKLYQGESTIDVARTVNNLANIHFSLGNLDDAMELYQESLEIKKQCLGDDSDEVANTLNNIAHVMVNAGREQEALSAYHDVVKIRQDRYGKSHVSVATTLASMGDVYIKLGKLEIAMTYFEQCIRIQKLRQDHCDERILENLGSIYGKLGEWHKAESTFKEIIELKRAAHGNECLDISNTLDLLAVSYIEQDRYAESIEHLQEALRIRKACLDDEDDEILASLNKLAFVYKSLDMTDLMLEVRGEFEAIQERRRR